MKEIPKYSELQLQIILDSTTTLPANISESVYENELRDNPRLKWKINPYLSKKQNLVIFLNSTNVKKWALLKNLNWLITVFIIVYSLLINDYKLLWTLLIYPLFMASGLLDHWIILFNLAIIFGLKLFIGFNNNYFWFTLSIILATYLLSKITQEFLERSIFKIAFSDPNTFWKYYSNRLIYIDETKMNNEFQNLALKYPELTN